MYGVSLLFSTYAQEMKGKIHYVEKLLMHAELMPLYCNGYSGMQTSYYNILGVSYKVAY